jgi:hypothetical protein
LPVKEEEKVLPQPHIPLTPKRLEKVTGLGRNKKFDNKIGKTKFDMRKFSVFVSFLSII